MLEHITGPALRALRTRTRLGRRDVIDSIRNPAEVAELRKLEGFHLLGIDAPVKLRFERSQRRGRAGDGETLEEFRRREEEENSHDPAAQQLQATFALADVRAANNGTLEELRGQVDRLLERWGAGLT